MTRVMVPIKQVCIKTNLSDPRDKPDSYFHYIDISSIDREQKTITQRSRILGQDAPSRARKEIKKGDVLISTVRPNLNAVAMVPEEYDNQVASTGFCVIRPNSKLLLNKYLFYYSLNSTFINSLVEKVRGAHYPAVSDRDVKNVKLPLPPISEQQRIVEILDQAYALRKKRAEADAKIERILPALFYKMFGDPATNTEGWKIDRLENGGASVRYGLGQPPQPDKRGVPLIRATNISRGHISEENMLYINRDDVPKNRNAFLSADEVIVVRSGAYTGDIAQVTEKWAGAVAGYDLVVSPGAQFLGEYIESYLLTPHIQNNYFGNLKARAGQPHLNAAQVSATPTLHPPKELQIKFAKQIHTIRKVKSDIVRVDEKINSLFDTILYRAFSGDLTAKWREAHMKELLKEMENQSKLLSKERDV